MNLINVQKPELSTVCEVISESQVSINNLIKPLQIYDGHVLLNGPGKNLNLTYCSLKLTQICGHIRSSESIEPTLSRSRRILKTCFFLNERPVETLLQSQHRLCPSGILSQCFLPQQCWPRRCDSSSQQLFVRAGRPTV